MRAEKIQKRLLKRNITEKLNIDDMIKNLKDDICELEKLKNNQSNTGSEIIGRTLYNLVTLSNEYNINSEQALYNFNKKMLKIMLKF